MNNRLKYHLMPRVGWMNDPNGLSYFDGKYHIFYQQDEKDIYGRMHRHWGHYTTKDFHSYTKETDAIYGDTKRDKNGAYSGSAIEKDGTLYLFYTGNVRHEGNYDYIHAGREHNVLRVESKDGIHFSNKQCLMLNKDYPEDCTCHVRDPKVYQENGSYYMLLGARLNDDTGCVLRFKSKDLENWQYDTRYVPTQTNGYMMECPNILYLNDQTFIMASPQGLKQDGYRYENVYDNGYYELNGTKLDNYKTLDHGFDFYAAQTFSGSNRSILIAWMGMPDAEYQTPTESENWMHALTLPRELSFNGCIRQYPIQEILDLREHEEKYGNDFKTTKFSSMDMDIHDEFELRMNDMVLSYREKLLTLDLSKCGCGRIKRHIEGIDISNLSIFIDISSIEIFVNKGEYVMTSRYFDNHNDMCVKFDGIEEIVAYKMKGFEIK
ncbi:glycoside hydrolase family 32 protein [Amedibacillus dolichus]|uniref:glycoside hydrolase family 32 protein n=1 Tax=Amedibacillus dolichus TaxID=31971 RepID=UPI0024322711|nr:glycoside hydrolase family 32 protein [Amedibacillus dolichus]